MPRLARRRETKRRSALQTRPARESGDKEATADPVVHGLILQDWLAGPRQGEAPERRVRFSRGRGPGLLRIRAERGDGAGPSSLSGLGRRWGRGRGLRW